MIRKLLLGVALAASAILLASCGGYDDTTDVVIYPSSVTLEVNKTLQFEGVVKKMLDPTVKWSVEETGGGTITSKGLYTAPSSPGTYHVVAKANSDSTMHNRATVTVVAASD